jgi:hypothetical protein
MEVHLLAIQARILLWVGFAYLAAGLYLGTDPATLAWRAALAAFLAMAAGGWLLRQVAGVIQERAVADEAERRLTEEQAAQAAAAKGQPAAQPAQARAAGPRK